MAVSPLIYFLVMLPPSIYATMPPSPEIDVISKKAISAEDCMKEWKRIEGSNANQFSNRTEYKCMTKEQIDQASQPTFPITENSPFINDSAPLLPQ